MEINNLTNKSIKAINIANDIAIQHNSQYIELLHIFYGIISSNYITKNILSKLDLNIPNLIKKIKIEIDKIPKNYNIQSPVLSIESNKMLYRAYNISRTMSDQFITLEHLLLGSIYEKNILTNLLSNNITYEKIKKIIMENRKNKKADSINFEEKNNILKKYAKNLTKLAKNGQLDPIIGREEEIRRVIQILSRRTKNNPLLVGEPGVGKTAIAEGIAHRIIQGDVPDDLLGKKVYSLDISSVIAGAKYKGEFEERLKDIVTEVINNKHIILFIDEIHTLVGAGSSEGAMDAANILKPSLARGQLRAIGATTLGEYQKYFEKDKALERRFQKVIINEPDENSAISILRGIKNKYEQHHKISIKDEAIIASVKLSNRYITDRYLPDKAIDLIDEASSKLRMEINSKPEEIAKLDRKIMDIEIEIEAIKKEENNNKLNILKTELKKIKSERSELNEKWQKEKQSIIEIQDIKKNIEDIKFKIEKAKREYDYAKASKLEFEDLMNLNKKLKNYKLNQNVQNTKIIKEYVDSNDIAYITSKWTGIPINKITKTESEKLMNLEKYLTKKVIGQEDAIKAISNCIRRSRTDLNDDRKPIGSFLFLGPTGVGKTELAKTISEFMFDDINSMVRIDMSEYQEKHSISRLIGSPPGYIGYEEGGQLTEVIRTKPYSVILLDEIEKAHQDIYSILLQILDEGHLTDSKGRKVNFKNTIIIMTSNFNSEEVIELNNLSTSKQDIIQNIKTKFKPELINRIDDIIHFNSLSKKDIINILKINIDKISKKLLSKDITLDITKEAIIYLAEKGYNIEFGARPIKRIIQTEILNELSKKIIQKEIQENSVILIDYNNSQLDFIIK